jgi:flagellar biogenesis protein FliO
MEGPARGVRGFLTVGVVALALSASAATAATAATGDAPTSQATTATASQYDSIQLRSGNRVADVKAVQSSAPTSGAMDASRVVVALGAVIGLIFAVRWAGRRLLGMNAAARGGGGAVQVLSRTTLSPKQQLMLVQVGKRVVLVANCGTQMNALCEISDPEEVAAIVGDVNRKAEPAAMPFLSSFGLAGNAYPERTVERHVSDGEQGEDECSVVTPTRAELAGLLEKVRLMSGTFRKT